MSAESLTGLFITYGYWIVFVAILLDHAGLPIPGELFLLGLGGIARYGQLDPIAGVAVAATAALAGDSAGYWAGRLGCDRLTRLVTLPRSPRIPGSVGVVFRRFVVGARVLVAPLAGCNRMPYPRFLVLDGVGCALWAGLFVLTGYIAGAGLA